MKAVPVHQREFILSLTYAGALEFDAGIDSTALIAHLADHLRKLNARDIKASQSSVSFRGGLFRAVSNWNVLIPFGYGELIVDKATHEVRYRLSFRQLIYTVTTLARFGMRYWMVRHEVQTSRTSGSRLWMAVASRWQLDAGDSALPAIFARCN